MYTNRPTAVSLITILFFLTGLLIVMTSLCTLFTPVPGTASLAPIVIGLLWLALGIFSFAVGWGLWTLQEWSRIAAIVLHALNLLGGLVLGAVFVFGVDISALDPYLGSFGGTLSFPGIGIGFWIVAALSGVVIWYLLLPEAQQAFLRPEPRENPRPEPQLTPTYLPRTERMSQLPAVQVGPSVQPPIEKTRIVDQRLPVQGWLAVRSGSRVGKQLALSTSSRNNIGRDASRCDLVLDDMAVSAEHARVQFEHGQFVIYDLASSNGTWVNNRRVQKQMLLDSDEIRLGDTLVVFKSVR
jgi:hypothetical protein